MHEADPLIAKIKTQYSELQKMMQPISEPTPDNPEWRISISRYLILSRLAQEHNFQRNPYAEEVEQAVEEWARMHKIWTERYSHDNNTMGAFLHDKTVNPELLFVANQIYEILFHVDNNISNDLLATLTPEQRQAAKKIMAEMASLFNDIHQIGQSRTTTPGVVTAAYEVLSTLKSQTAENPNPLATKWFEGFFNSLKEHLEQTAIDQNWFIDYLVQLVEVGEITREEAILHYFELRDRIAGMFVTTELIEHTSNQYVDRENLPDDIKRDWLLVRRYSAFLGSVLNDVYSSEKEIILAGDKFNLISLLMALDPDLTLVDAISQSIRYVNQATEYLTLVSNRLESKLSGVMPSQQDALRSYIARARSVAIAAHEWEIATDRYQKWDNDQVGIFAETDRGRREKSGVVGILKSGQPLPADYQRIVERIYRDDRTEEKEAIHFTGAL